MNANSEPVLISEPLDQYGAELLKAAALPLLVAGGDVAFRFTATDRMHAACLQVLLALRTDLQTKGRKVILEGVDPEIRKLFRISGTEQLFTFTEAIH